MAGGRWSWWWWRVDSADSTKLSFKEPQHNTMNDFWNPIWSWEWGGGWMRKWVGFHSTTLQIPSLSSWPSTPPSLLASSSPPSTSSPPFTPLTPPLGSPPPPPPPPPPPLHHLSFVRFLSQLSSEIWILNMFSFFENGIGGEWDWDWDFSVLGSGGTGLLNLGGKGEAFVIPLTFWVFLTIQLYYLQMRDGGEFDMISYLYLRFLWKSVRWERIVFSIDGLYSLVFKDLFFWIGWINLEIMNRNKKFSFWVVRMFCLLVAGIILGKFLLLYLMLAS